VARRREAGCDVATDRQSAHGQGWRREVLGTAHLDQGLVATAISPVAPRQGQPFMVKAKVGKTELSAPYKDSSHLSLKR